MLVGKTQQFAAIAERSTAMFGSSQSAILIQPKPHCVIDLPTIVQHSASFELVGQRSFSQLVGVEVVVPQQKVVDGAHQSTAAHHVELGGPVDEESAVWAGVVGSYPAGQYQLVVVVEACVRHAEGLEDVLRCKFGERFAGGALHDHAE